MKQIQHISIYCFLFLLLLIAPVTAGLLADVDDRAIIDYYSGVQAWGNFSRRYDISKECASEEPLRVAYFTKHDGTTWDFISVATRLNVPYTRVNPMLFTMNFATDANSYSDYASAERVWQAVGQMECHMGDILMFGDVLSFSRPVLQGNCTTPTILHVTNRFSALMPPKHLQKYEELMAQAATWPHVWFLCNNPYEPKFFEMRGITLPPERTKVLRPVGISLLPRPPPLDSPSMRMKVAVVNNPNRTTCMDVKVVIPWIEQESLLDLVTLLPKKYGGPYALAEIRGLIHIPYQVSVMKMYEGLAAGAVFILPTTSFFEKLLQELPDNKLYNFCCRDLVANVTDWYEYVDWYHKDFRDCHVYFDSWSDLKQIIKGEGKYTPELFEEKKLVGRQTMQRIRGETLAGFEQLFKDMKKKACEDNGKPDVWSVGMGKPVYRFYNSTS